MIKKKQILAINGSASKNSNNLAIINHIAKIKETEFDLKILDDLTVFPHFQTELTNENVPNKIIELRNEILKTDGIIICTPEYVFSIPSGLKNILEWCVSTTVFSNKPLGIITASASGEKAHEELKLIMETLQTNFKKETTLRIQGLKGKINKKGAITDIETENELKEFVKSLDKLISENLISK